MIVADCSAIVSALLNDGPARRYLGTEKVCVPHLVDSELPNAIRRLVLTKHLGLGDGWGALETWAQLGVSRYPAAGLLTRIWDLRNNVTAYDATYVALAEALSCPLVTADSRLASVTGLDCAIMTVPR